MYVFSEPIEILNTRSRNKREAEDDGVLPRIPNPIACLSPGDMLIFYLTINHTGTQDFIKLHHLFYNVFIFVYF